MVRVLKGLWSDGFVSDQREIIMLRIMI